MRSGLITSIGLKVIHVDFYRIWFLAVVEAPWGLNFFEGLYMYTYTEPTNHFDPPLPHCYCTSVHYCTFVHYCTLVHYCTFVHWSSCPVVDGQVARLPAVVCVKGFFLLLGSDAFNRLSFTPSFTPSFTRDVFNRDIFTRLLFTRLLSYAYSGMLWRVKSAYMVRILLGIILNKVLNLFKIYTWRPLE